MCGLRQVQSLRVLIPAATSTSAWQAKHFRCAILTPRRPIAPPAVQSMSLAEAAFLETLSCCFLLLPLHVLRGHEPLTALAKQEQLKRADLESVVLAGSSLSSVNGALSSIVCFRVSVRVILCMPDTVIFKEKGRSDR